MSSFNLDEFKLALAPFGTLTYARIFDEGLESEYLEFAVDNVNYLYSVTNFGVFTTTQILPYYPNLVVVSMDKLRLKGAFKKN
jgi:hypothetical protein